MLLRVLVSFAAIFMIASVSFAATSPPRRVSATYTDAPIGQVLLDLGKRFGVTIVVAHDVQGRVSITLHAATLDDSLRALLSPGGFRYVHTANIIIVSSRSGTPISTA